MDTCGCVSSSRVVGAMSCPGHYNDEQWIVAPVWQLGRVFLPVFIIHCSSSAPHASCQIPRPDIIIPGKLQLAAGVTRCVTGPLWSNITTSILQLQSASRLTCYLLKYYQLLPPAKTQYCNPVSNLFLLMLQDHLPQWSSPYQ